MHRSVVPFARRRVSFRAQALNLLWNYTAALVVGLKRRNQSLAYENKSWDCTWSDGLARHFCNFFIWLVLFPPQCICLFIFHLEGNDWQPKASGQVFRGTFANLLLEAKSSNWIIAAFSFGVFFCSKSIMYILPDHWWIFYIFGLIRASGSTSGRFVVDGIKISEPAVAQTLMDQLMHRLKVTTKSTNESFFFYPVKDFLTSQLPAITQDYNWTCFLTRRHLIASDWVLLMLLVKFSCRVWRKKRNSSLGIFPSKDVTNIRAGQLNKRVSMRKPVLLRYFHTDDIVSFIETGVNTFQWCVHMGVGHM